MTPEQKHYYAFVSHSSRDAKIALWLRDKLVNYNIPASIRKENQMPKRLRPVFIYQTDLVGANLRDALQRELEDSQWLIVVCSPDGAKSQYVNGEVEHFINTGRANRIIPLFCRLRGQVGRAGGRNQAYQRAEVPPQQNVSFRVSPHSFRRAECLAVAGCKGDVC